MFPAQRHCARARAREDLRAPISSWRVVMISLWMRFSSSRNISGPGVLLESGEGIGTDMLQWNSIGCAMNLEEVFAKQGNITDAITERRKMDGDDVDAVVEIFAKFAGPRQFLQRLIGGADQPEIDLSERCARPGVAPDDLRGHAEAWFAGEALASQSRPETACPRRPARYVPAEISVAPVKAPRSLPKSSDSIRFSGRAAQFKRMKGLLARALSATMARAASSFPVPLSPRISTLMLLAAIC